MITDNQQRRSTSKDLIFEDGLISMKQRRTERDTEKAVGDSMYQLNLASTYWGLMDFPVKLHTKQ